MNPTNSVITRFGTAALIAASVFMPAATFAQKPLAKPAMMATGHREYVPNRVYDSRKKQWIDFETLTERANSSEMVFVGEQHDNSDGHALELALLEGIARRRKTGGGPVVLSLEMFERDVQSDLNAYLSGEKDEQAFLAASRPWPNYANDYRPLVELARSLKWPVIAANVPRPLASAVSHGGLKALDTLNSNIRTQQIATDISCPRDDYFKLFSEVMSGGHGGQTATAPTNADSVKAAKATEDAMTFRFYEAQCVKDETMGESVARSLASAKASGGNALVVHMNGSFHTDYALGTAERAIKRAKGAKHIVISIVPTPNLDTVDAKSMRKRADYLVFTLGKSE
ncbi:MAG: ChaN family lipoprotein [Gemmatimonadaceae bacterium]